MHLLHSLVVSVPYVLVGVLGLVLAGTYRRPSRVLALVGSVLALVYGLVWLVVLVLGLAPPEPVWRILEYGSLAVLLATAVILALAGMRRDDAAPRPAAPAGPPGAAPAWQPAPPAQGTTPRPPYQGGV